MCKREKNMHLNLSGILSLFAALVLALTVGAQARAENVWITPDMPFFEYTVRGQTHVIERDQNEESTITGSFAKTSRKCPPFCIHPMIAAEGVKTVGELELLEFVADYVETDLGLLVDARLANWYDAGTIPGSVNLPFNLFNPDDNPFFVPVVSQLGAKRKDDGSWDFAGAKRLLLFCNGPWCGQSPRAIRNLVSIGYPAEKLYYYRGGMQSWLMMGLPTVKPEGV